MLRIFALAVLLAGFGAPVHAHDIYTGVTGKNGQLCCGANDCSATVYREHGGSYEFLTREGHWIPIPQERITFLPIPGDPPSDDSHRAHLCYREPMGYERSSGSYFASTDEVQAIVLYCVFVPPGGV